jgi:hypothetical protein
MCCPELENVLPREPMSTSAHRLMCRLCGIRRRFVALNTAANSYSEALANACFVVHSRSSVTAMAF